MAPHGRLADQAVLWGLAVQIVVLPLQYNDIPLYTAFFISLAGLLYNLAAGRSRARTTPLDVPLALFIIAGLTSLLFSVDRLETLDEIRGDIIVPTVTFFIAAWGIWSRDQLRGITRAAVFGQLLLGVYGLLHFYIVGGTLDSYAYREASLADDFHYFGTYLLVAFPLVVLAALRETDRIWRWASRAGAVITAPAAYITFDRGCWGGLILMGLILYPLLVSNFKTYLKWLALSILIVIVVVPSGVLIHGEKAGLYSGDDIEANTLSMRMTVWNYCLRNLAVNPFTGFGFGRHNFKKAYPEFYKKYKYYQLWHCHNSYLDLALQLGLPGLAVFLGLILTAFTAAFNQWRRAGPLKDWGAVGMLILIGFTARLFWDSFYIDEHIRLLWLTLGAVFAARRLEQAD